MADRISKEQRSWNMSRIKSKDTKIEILVRKFLFSRGFRYRVNVSSLPGKPDIVLKKYKTVIFVNGCFWHRHENCKYAYNPKTNNAFWNEKFLKNIDNDKKNESSLSSSGWNVITVWECELKNDFAGTMNKLENLIKNGD